MKRCFKCGETKPRLEFYRHKDMADGFLGKCKECTKKDSSTRYYKNHKQILMYERKRFKHPQRKISIAASQRERRKKNPEKYKARTAVSNAIRDGKLIRLPCEKCGNEKSQAHHDDYSKHLNVRWLCRTCHVLEHGNIPFACERE